MSWFSREWDGVHMEGCPLNLDENETMEVPPGETVVVREIEDSRWTVVSEDECACPDLMVERAVSAADSYRDQIQEGQMR